MIILDFSFLLNIPLSVLSIIVVFALTKEQTNRRIVLFGLQNAVYGGKIEVELTGIIGLKLARL